MNLIKYATIAALVIAIGGISEAARRHHHHRTAGVYAAAALCETDKDYYATHSQYCDSAERRGLIQIRHRAARAEFPPVQGFDEVTTYRDTQAADDGGHQPDRTIRLQTAENVAHSSPWYAAAAAVFNPGSVILGVQRVARVMAPAMAAAPQPARLVTRTATVARPMSLTTDKAVTITIRPVTMAQQ